MLKTKKQGRLRRILAADANLKIEGGEVVLANLLKAVNVIEAQTEGYSPREAGLDFDENASIDEIVEKLFPNLDEGAKTDVKNMLESLKNSAAEATEEEATEEEATDEEATDEEAAEATEEVKDEEAVEEDKDEEVDERFNNPDFKAGYEAGIKEGAKLAKENEQAVTDEAERKISEDSIAKIQERIAKEMRQSMRELNNAAQKVQPLVGTIKDVMAFDSATEIYKFALQYAGKKVENYPKEAYAGMVDILLEQHSDVVIGDSAPMYKGAFSEKEQQAFNRLAKISK